MKREEMTWKESEKKKEKKEREGNRKTKRKRDITKRPMSPVERR